MYLYLLLLDHTLPHPSTSLCLLTGFEPPYAPRFGSGFDESVYGSYSGHPVSQQLSIFSHTISIHFKFRVRDLMILMEKTKEVMASNNSPATCSSSSTLLMLRPTVPTKFPKLCSTQSYTWIFMKWRIFLQDFFINKSFFKPDVFFFLVKSRQTLQGIE